MIYQTNRWTKLKIIGGFFHFFIYLIGTVLFLCPSSSAFPNDLDDSDVILLLPAYDAAQEAALLAEADDWISAREGAGYTIANLHEFKEKMNYEFRELHEFYWITENIIRLIRLIRGLLSRDLILNNSGSRSISGKFRYRNLALASLGQRS